MSSHKIEIFAWYCLIYNCTDFIVFIGKKTAVRVLGFGERGASIRSESEESTVKSYKNAYKNLKNVDINACNEALDGKTYLEVF